MKIQIVVDKQSGVMMDVGAFHKEENAINYIRARASFAGFDVSGVETGEQARELIVEIGESKTGREIEWYETYVADLPLKEEEL